MNTERGSVIGSHLNLAMISSMLLFAVLTLLLGFTGEITILNSIENSGIRRIFLKLDRPFFFPIIAAIVSWDIGLYFCAWAGLSRIEHRGVKGEILLAGVLVFALWRVVGNSIASLLFLPGRDESLSIVPNFFESFVIIGVLVPGKWIISRNLEQAARRLDAPLLEVFTWHHRKDAVFNTIFAITLASAGFGWDDGRVAYFCHFVKILLLGSASWKISRRCIERLAPHAVGELPV
ncbi:MAG: hypothetical protein WA705_30355 [Candidatus Ozemobacteraceae bacterium]